MVVFLLSFHVTVSPFVSAQVPTPRTASLPMPLASRCAAAPLRVSLMPFTFLAVALPFPMYSVVSPEVYLTKPELLENVSVPLEGLVCTTAPALEDNDISTKLPVNTRVPFPSQGPSPARAAAAPGPHIPNNRLSPSQPLRIRV